MTQMTAAEYDRLSSSGYDSSELIGRYGLESAWENYLRGKKGTENFAVDARGRRLDEATAATLIKGERIIDPVPGANLVLTIDAGLQRAAEKAVAHLPAAAVVVTEVRTGRLLALVSKPSFDPNIMTGHLTRAEETLLLSDPRKPFIDKALRMFAAPRRRMDRDQRGHRRERSAHEHRAAVTGAGAGAAQRERRDAGDGGGRDHEPEVLLRGQHRGPGADGHDHDDRHDRREQHDERDQP
jgi:hypothetical protein